MTTIKSTSLEEGTTKTKLSKQKRIINFISGAFSGTGQKEFYNTKEEQQKALLDSHKPILSEYREFYALLPIAPINDLNKQIAIYNLLDNSKDINKDQKYKENEIIYQSLQKMRTPRAYRTFRMLRELGVNNARTRWLAKKFLSSRKNIEFEALKYKKLVKELVVHNHIHINSEVFDFLFDKKEKYDNELFNNYVKAKDDMKYAYELPYTVAEGFAAYHDIPREEFLENIKGQMTESEKLRMQEASKKHDVDVEADWTKFGLIKLYKYLRTLDNIPPNTKPTIKEIAQKEARKIPHSWNKVRVVIDNSGSSYGSAEKKNHPIALYQALSKVLEQKADDFKEYLVNGTRKDRTLIPIGGATDLARPLLKALQDKPDLLLILSDGYENQLSGLASQIINAYQKKIDNKITIGHLNPVFAAEAQTSRSLGEQVPSFGIRGLKQITGSFFMLEARRNLNEAIKQFEEYLLKQKQDIALDELPNYLLN